MTLSDNNQELGRLDTEQVNAATATIDQMSPLEIVRAMNAEDAKVAAAVEQELPAIAQAIEALTLRMRQGGRLVYVGAGTSGRLGILDASECPPTFSIEPDRVIGVIAGGPIAMNLAAEDAEDSAEAGCAALTPLEITAIDTVVGIAASGRTPYVLGAIAAAHEKGALTIGVACNAQSPLAAAVDISISPVVGPEAITGSTRLKAGTAQKMVLNMLSTGTMILQGKTYGNLMVDVNATNYKLEQRAAKIVQTVTGQSLEQAQELLRECAGETKTAIVVALHHISPVDARMHLAAHNYELRPTLGALQ
ncbi:MAG TPA: N-acetylmuramic acid 6-phosphate etherase [Dictyobacter sp.]|nr:N-acetylmuramic acid 6-phosphate etherase [Dictyobacter sp.]